MAMNNQKARRAASMEKKYFQNLVCHTLTFVSIFFNDSKSSVVIKVNLLNIFTCFPLTNIYIEVTGQRHSVQMSLACVLSLAIFWVLLQFSELCLVLGIVRYLVLNSNYSHRSQNSQN